MFDLIETCRSALRLILGERFDPALRYLLSAGQDLLGMVNGFWTTKRWAVLLAWLSTSIAADSLAPWAVAPLPLGSIQPNGWLRKEMQTMASGLAGHEHDFYVFVNESRWLYPQGSTEGIDYSNLNEGLPYWFNGLVPLAYSLDDERLKGQVHSVAEKVLSLQTSDGWIGPEDITERNFWARSPFLLGLTQLVEANASWEGPVLSALARYTTLTNEMLRNNGSGLTDCAADVDCSWGQARIHDQIITVQWLLEHHPSDQDGVLWDNMRMFESGKKVDWVGWFGSSSYPKVVQNTSATGPDLPYLHGVNVGQGLKSAAVTWRHTHDDSLIRAAERGVNLTFAHHGAPSGTILADEIQRELAPYTGSELCMAVETAYSMSYLYHVLGTTAYADRAELVTFNALPVMLTGDHWAHQYMDSPNQPFASNVTQDFEQGGEHVFTTANSGLATTYGMEPQYPCCTVNHAQGYPKFLAQSWGTVDDRAGLAHLLLSPSKLTTTLKGDKQVSVSCETSYPFDHVLVYTIDASGAFDLHLRVPEWSTPSKSSLSINDGQASPLSPSKSTGLHRLSLPRGKSTVTYTVGAEIRSEPRSNHTVAIYHGSLLYALDITSSTTSSLPHAYTDATGPGIAGLPFPQLSDHYYTNTSAWNIAIDPSTLAFHGLAGAPLPEPVFDRDAPVGYVTVRGCQLAWDVHLGVTPDWAPTGRDCLDEPREYRLRPYGTAKLHMSELPVMKMS